jgi:hypothetical protein
MRSGTARRRSPSSRARGAALFFLAAIGALFVSSCVGVLGLDGYRAAPDALCALLDRCFGEDGFAKCEGHVSSQLAAATPETREDWLSAFTDSGCLTSCDDALKCLDVRPVCRGPRESCTSNEQCCGFHAGAGTCTLSNCCVKQSAPCKQDIDCCVGTCTGDPPTCGGSTCGPAGASCTQNAECCTDHCIPGQGVCSATTCRPAGFDCAQNFDCCTGICDGGKCATCVADGHTCLTDGNCCSGMCDDTLGHCGAMGCLQENVACTSDDQCCSGFCADGIQLCAQPTVCTNNGQPCKNEDECCVLHCNEGGTCGCESNGESCYEDFTCCSGNCKDGKCAPCQQPWKPCGSPSECCSGVCVNQVCCQAQECEHSVCQQGDALGPVKCSMGGKAAEAECVKTICDVAPECCCFYWSGKCVEEVAKRCQLDCDAP